MTGPDPVVSVLMPTYRQEAFLPRALNSLLAQSYQDWELIVVNDGSTEEVKALLDAVPPSRAVYHWHERNKGLGASLNCATRLAAGALIAYLPSDDLWDRHHLRDCVELLARRQEIYAAYGGVRWVRDARVASRAPEATATLRGDVLPGGEWEALEAGAEKGGTAYDVPSGNVLALVQVVHRRGLEARTRWAERDEVVSDALEFDFWRGIHRAGGTFAHTGRVSCEWGAHEEQRHKIITGRGSSKADWRNHAYGLSHYRQFYGIEPGVRINWQPSAGGLPVDERRRYAGLTVSSAPGNTSLKILLVGSLSFNPERLLAFEDRGHRLFGLWMPRPHFWDTSGPLPFGNIGECPPDTDWLDWVRRIEPDVVYALLNWNALPFIHTVMERLGGIPFVFHFKESPFMAMQAGSWPLLKDIITGCDACIFSSLELRDWFSATMRGVYDGKRALVIDGDLPSARWMTDGWPIRRLSDHDGEVHTVCVGRTLVERAERLAGLGVHVHVYSQPHMRFGPRWLGAQEQSEYLHLHAPVDPAEWASELGAYDAGWLHIFESANCGEILSATWDDLNTPVRIGTYAAAGLPWIMRKNDRHRVAVNRLGEQAGCAIAYQDMADLVEQLQVERKGRERSTAARTSRRQFSFDAYVDELIELFSAL